MRDWINNDKSQLSFTNCNFQKYASFNDSKLDSLLISKTTFDKKVSFDKLIIKSLSFYQVSFLQGAFFDDIKIENIEDQKFINRLSKIDAKNLKSTVRQIKQELQKAENKIDYNPFRSYELSAYYRELTWNENFRDKSILWATKYVTGFDHSWSRAFRFTIISGLIIYSLIYFYEYRGSYDYKELNNYFTGAFRFFLITDFSSPFKNKGEYLEDAWLWIPLIFGKIVIAFGIYEMIQAFRKFKA